MVSEVGIVMIHQQLEHQEQLYKLYFGQQEKLINQMIHLLQLLYQLEVMDLYMHYNIILQDYLILYMDLMEDLVAVELVVYMAVLLLVVVLVVIMEEMVEIM